MIDLAKVNEVASLRKKWSVDKVRIAVELCRARNIEICRLNNAETIVADLAGVQQASSTVVATWKAKRFENVEVVDLCSGIGVDLKQLPETASSVELDPLRCWMAKQNTSNDVVAGDACSYKVPKTAVIHLDPSRRDAKSDDWDSKKCNQRLKKCRKFAPK